MTHVAYRRTSTKHKSTAARKIALTRSNKIVHEVMDEGVCMRYSMLTTVALQRC